MREWKATHRVTRKDGSTEKVMLERISGLRFKFPEKLLRCSQCGEKLQNDRVVWLELNNKTNTYHRRGDVPEKYSQGSFPFGRDCARRALTGREASHA